MKKICIMLLLLSLILVGCGESTDSDELTVVATLFPQYDFARNIVGENAQVDLLLDFGTDSHSYDPTPLDMMKIAKADLFIYTGDSMELWAKKLLESADIARAIGSGSLKVLDLSQSVEPVCIHTHDDEHEHSDYDAHIWTSPTNAIAMSKTICETLVGLDGENAESYRANFDAYSEKLTSLSDLLNETLESARLDEVYFGGSFAFAYLFEEYGLSHVSVYEGCASHAEPAASDIAEVVKAIRDAGAKYVVYDTETEKRIAQTIANECGAALLRLHAVHNISKDEFQGGEDYFSLMTKNIETLGKALS